MVQRKKSAARKKEQERAKALLSKKIRDSK
jgi:hypothetical protein